MSDEAFEADLLALGFRYATEGRTGVRNYARAETSCLTYWVHWNPDEHTVLFTWEHAIGEYMSANGLQIGANEELNQFLFPKNDARGPQDITFVVREIDHAEAVLRAVNLLG